MSRCKHFSALNIHQLPLENRSQIGIIVNDIGARAGLPELLTDQYSWFLHPTQLVLLDGYLAAAGRGCALTFVDSQLYSASSVVDLSQNTGMSLPVPPATLHP